ncbi:cell division cycle-associated protein 3 [Etheostoma cragini]|uniref:cell division cycle-associated protein 3 n=1 Tax=Etheostoma cragini TaxID=417921 RepID=UPI00155E517D|nr:cell division cycle-associated protein 3 [Etheostoma cragini]XP_034730161.1 cell division cycle-associated protein 3 [Etheostoma cragini]XP_034730162.1 cell division cycle-associated protein 3 [Etheostoma cragini]
MGSSESKMVVSAPIKPEPAIKNSRVSDLIDPRSPSTGVVRTPIQLGGPVSKTECPLAFTDPRSPTVGVCRTPIREVMRATVGSFAHRLSMLLHNEAEGKVPKAPQKFSNDAVEEEVSQCEELASTEPLLPPQSSHTFGSMAEHAYLLATPVQTPLQSVGDSSPFVLLEKPQVDVDIETETDITLEEAEEAKESPLHKRLSMSLITCHEGATSSQIFAEVHSDSTSSPVQSVEVEQLGDGVDHSYALPSVTVEPESPVEPSLPSDLDSSHVQSEEAKSSSEVTKGRVEESSLPSPLEQPQLSAGIRCPTFDSKSPSQVVFKPQWLGKGFGATQPRARRVQAGKGGSSPLAVHVAVKKATMEINGQSGKLKQKGIEGRSPLQILKGTNSPRGQRSQMKLKMSTPDKQRLGPMDRRMQAVSLDKENR